MIIVGALCGLFISIVLCCVVPYFGFIVLGCILISLVCGLIGLLFKLLWVIMKGIGILIGFLADAVTEEG